MRFKKRALLATAVIAACGASFVGPVSPARAADRPSDAFCSSTVPILDGTVAGVYTKLAVQSAPTTAVCFRVDGFGGAVQINGASLLPVIDSDMTACTSWLVDQSVLGAPVRVGMSSGLAFLCVQVDTTAVRVGVNITGNPAVTIGLDERLPDVPDTGPVPNPLPGCPGNRVGPSIPIPVICIQHG